jgi:hypothetical protein
MSLKTLFLLSATLPLADVADALDLPQEGLPGFPVAIVWIPDVV